jgi:hypothetical protein
MAILSTNVWVVVLVGLATLGLLNTLAARIRNETTVHDLRARVFDMRAAYLRKLIATYRPDPNALGSGDQIYTDNDIAVTEVHADTSLRKAA